MNMNQRRVVMTFLESENLSSNAFAKNMNPREMAMACLEEESQRVVRLE